MREVQPRVTTIEGRKALVVERRPPLPPSLATLLGALRVYPIRITGWRSMCGEQDHRLRLFAEGPYRCLDGVRRDLRVLMCLDCESVQVRDVSIDRLAGLPTGSLAPRRRDLVLAWYTGARRNQRTYGRAM